MRHIAVTALATFLLTSIPGAAAPQDRAQEWIPPAIDLPADRTVTVNRAIGSSTRIFIFETASDGDALIDAWRASLDAAGFTVEAPREELGGGEIRFSGPGIGNAKIAVQPSAGSGRTVVQIDASLDD